MVKQLKGPSAAYVGFVFGFVIVSIVFMIVMAYPVMLLWNGALVPAVSGVNEVGFWQAFGLILLARIILDSSLKVNIKA